MTRADQDTYIRQAGDVARRLGADPVPETRAEAEALITRFRPELRCTQRTSAVARTVLSQPAPSCAMAPVQRLLMRAAVDLMPGWAKQMHRLHGPDWSTPLVRAGSFAIAKTLQWAFGEARRPPAS